MNYLPKAPALTESLRHPEDGAVLRILFIDVADERSCRRSTASSA